MLTGIKKLAIFLFLAGAIPAFGQEYFGAENYGGKQQLKDFIKEELVYPRNALANKIEGTVDLSFRVKNDGSIEKLQVSKSAGPELDEEAMRIFKLLLWEPASYRGMKMDEDKVLQISFKLKKYHRCIKSRGYDQIEYPVQPIDTSLVIYESYQLKNAPKPLYDEKSMNFNKFLMKNLSYPANAQKRGISGTVELFFVVEPSGRVSNIDILSPVGAGCNQEAIRLLKMLNWKPGVKDGHAVRTSINLSITFSMEDFEKHRYVPASNNNQI